MTKQKPAHKPGNADPGTEKPLMERREAPAFSKRERGKTEDWCATRCSIPSIFEGKRKGPAKAGMEDGLPGADKEYGR